jgi:hypothetical protein
MVTNATQLKCGYHNATRLYRGRLVRSAPRNQTVKETRMSPFVKGLLIGSAIVALAFSAASADATLTCADEDGRHAVWEATDPVIFPADLTRAP